MSSRDLNPTAASLLGFLHAGPLTGWDLDQAVSASIGNFWNVTRSQIYRELRSLSEQGHVAAGASGPRDRVPYTLTASGRDVFKEWISRTPGPDMIRSRLLLTVFFGEHLDRDRLGEIADEQRRDHASRLDSYLALQDELGDQGGFPARTLAFGIGYERAMVDWLETVLADLAD